MANQATLLVNRHKLIFTDVIHRKADFLSDMQHTLADCDRCLIGSLLWSFIL